MSPASGIGTWCRVMGAAYDPQESILYVFMSLVPAGLNLRVRMFRVHR